MKTLSAFLMFAFTINTAANAYVYCISTSNHGYEITPKIDNIPFIIEGASLTEGKEINFNGGMYKYTVNNEDIKKNEFSSGYGLLTPYAYFLFPRDKNNFTQAKMKQMTEDLINQCVKYFDIKNDSSKIVKEIRFSDSLFSGSNILKAGYPLVYINPPVKTHERNIYRLRANSP